MRLSFFLNDDSGLDFHHIFRSLSYMAMSEEPGDAATAGITFFFSLMWQGLVVTDALMKL